MRDIKPVYKDLIEEAGLLALYQLEEKWGNKYPYPINSWRDNWNNLAVFFKYPEQIGKVFYTTNAVENLLRQFRKVTKNRALFPNNDALTKIYLAYRDISKKWTMPIRDWTFIFSQFSIIFDKRLKPFIK
ncbi:MAG: transposase [Chlorobi bacterium]|nr:transposase [Chlorobiota bacterium]